MAIENYDCEGTLTIGGILMNRAAFAIIGDDVGEGGLLQLWAETEVRGSDRLIPAAAGVIPYQRRLKDKLFDLRLLVCGDVTQAGVANADFKAGLVTNLAYIYTNVVAPTGTGDGTRAATLTFSGVTSRTANIHVLGMRKVRYNLAADSAIWEGLLSISIPAGRFA